MKLLSSLVILCLQKNLINISESFLTFWFCIYVAPEYQQQKYFACLLYSVSASIDSLSRNMARKIFRIYQVQDLFDLLVMNSRIHRHKLQTWTIEKCSCKYEKKILEAKIVNVSYRPWLFTWFLNLYLILYTGHQPNSVESL